jgi:hypothetical protein
VPGASARRGAGRGFVLAMLLVGVGCGENVLVGNLQLRSLSDAGTDIVDAVEVDAVEVDAGINLQGRAAERAAKHAKDKSEQKDRDNNHADDKGH